MRIQLSAVQLCILRQAAWSCRDDDGFLNRTRSWLGDKCSVSLRSLERHLPQLEKLGLLVWNGEGFRLPAYLESCGNLGTDRQIGGLTANLSANLRKEKESTKEKESSGDFLGRASGTARSPLSAKTLGKIWGAIAAAGRNQNASIDDPSCWDDFHLVAVDAHVMRVFVPPRRSWGGWEAEITRAAIEARMLRGRRIEIVESYEGERPP